MIKLLLLAILFVTSLCQAREIVVGQVAPILDPLVAGYQMKSGIELYFDVVNRSGGVLGATLRLASKDRSVTGSDSVPKTLELIEEARPVALIGLLGTGPMDMLVKQGVLDKVALPVVGIRSGSTSLHQPVNPWLFHTRANYAAEAEKIVSQMTILGFRKIAVFYENTTFGKEALRHAVAALDKANLKAVAVATYELSTNEVTQALAVLRAAAPDAVIVASSSSAASELYRAIRRGASQPMQLIAFSTVDATTVVKLIGKADAKGLGIVQVVPDPASRSTLVAREFQDNARKLRPAQYELTQGALEGYVAVKVLVQGLKRAGPIPTPEKLRLSLEAMKAFDAGGFVVGFSANNHSGSGYLSVGILGADGKIRQ